MRAVHASRRIILAGSIVAAAALALPFITSEPTGPLGGVREAAPVVVLLVAVAITAVVGDRREGFPRAGAVVASLVAGIAVILAVHKMLDAMRAVRGLESLGIDASMGIGPWLLAGGAIIVLMGAAMSLSRRLL